MIIYYLMSATLKKPRLTRYSDISARKSCRERMQVRLLATVFEIRFLKHLPEKYLGMHQHFRSFVFDYFGSAILSAVSLH